MNKSQALIIEDDPQLCTIFSLTIRNDFDYVTIQDGVQAIDYLRQNEPDLIILDLNLPGASGRQILRYVRGEARLQAARVILATADAEQANDLAGQADLVLLKPISPNQLRVLAVRIGKQ